MDKLENIFKHNSKYVKLSKPLEAAKVCEIARKLAQGHYQIISFKDGLLTIGFQSPGQGANLQTETSKIIDGVNRELKEEKVKKLRFRIV